MSEMTTSAEQAGAGHRDGLWARTGSMLSAGWLLVSAFAWESSGPQRTNAAVSAYLIFVLALLATGLDRVRILTTLVSTWVALSVWLLPGGHPLMQWNATLFGTATLLLSLVSKQGSLALHLPGLPEWELRGPAHHQT
jgi:hypothetical protein